MIDNFDRFKFERKDGEFYYISLIKRAKDNPGVIGINGNNSYRIIREYSIPTQADLDKRKQEMIDIATATNSRVYIHPARRGYEDIKKLMALLIGEHIALGRHGLGGMYRHACGLSKGTERLWVVDIDNDKGIPIGMIRETIRLCMPNVGTDKTVLLLPTKRGYHLITIPFNLEEFKQSHPTIDVHKNNPTILYIP